MKINFSSPSGVRIDLDLDPNDTVEHVKQIIGESKDVQIADIKLIFKSKFLKNEAKLSECGITDNSKIILMIPNAKPATVPQQKTENVEQNAQPDTKPAAIAPLPTVDAVPIREDPPDFEQKIEQLQQMGYEYADCRKALRASLYSIESAANYLISGHIPDEPVFAVNNIAREFDEDGNENEEEDDNVFRISPELMQKYYDHPETIGEFFDLVQQYDPTSVVLIKNNPRLLLAQFGFDPTKFDLSKFEEKTMYQQLLSKFTDEEKEAVKRLEAKGYDSMEILQMFEACNRDEKLTEECLKSTKS